MKKNNNKNSSARRKLAAAIAMLMISTLLLSSATYAWFTMNKTVSVTNMQVKAKADQGLLINEVAVASDSNWDELATTNQATGIQLHATSTANTSTWYAAYSKKSNDAAAATSSGASANLIDGYHLLGSGTFATDTSGTSATAGSNAAHEIVYIDKDSDGAYDEGEGYYVKYTYYLKSSADEITCSLAAGGQSLNIEDVNVEGVVSGTSGSADLDKALRVAIVVNGYAYIYAPVYDTTSAKYYVNATTETTPLDKTTSQATAMGTIPAVTEDGTPVYVYLYFEGEDINLMTDNVTETLDNLIVSFKLSIVDNENEATNNGVAVPTT